MNKIDNITFTGVKYTSAGKRFVKSQSKNVQEKLNQTERNMKKHRYTNLIVNSNGYAIQYADSSGRHTYRIKNILYSCDYDVIYYLDGKQGITTLKFYNGLDLSPKSILESATNSANDAKDNNHWLNSTIQLTNILEQRGGYTIKPSLKDKIINLFKIHH